MATYLEKMQARKQAAERDLRRNLRNEAYRLARLLERENGLEFTRIFLWGSTVSSKPLSPWSDIDLVIEGLRPSVFYKAYAVLLKHSDFPIDLKPMEDLDKSIKNRVRKEGEVIYEK